MADIIKHAQGVHAAIAADLEGFGGVLRCTGACKRESPLDEACIARYLRDGWPKCCGYTMRWVTQRQMDELAVEYRTAHYTGYHHEDCVRVFTTAGEYVGSFTPDLVSELQSVVAQWQDGKDRAAMTCQTMGWTDA